MRERQGLRLKRLHELRRLMKDFLWKLKHLATQHRHLKDSQRNIFLCCTMLAPTYSSIYRKLASSRSEWFITVVQRHRRLFHSIKSNFSPIRLINKKNFVQGLFTNYVFLWFQSQEFWDSRKPLDEIVKQICALNSRLILWPIPGVVLWNRASNSNPSENVQKIIDFAIVQQSLSNFQMFDFSDLFSRIFLSQSNSTWNISRKTFQTLFLLGFVHKPLNMHKESRPCFPQNTLRAHKMVRAHKAFATE